MSGRHRARASAHLVLIAASFGIASSALAQIPASDTLPAVRVTVLRTPFDVTTAPMNVASVGARDIAVARPGFSVDEALGQVAGPGHYRQGATEYTVTWL